MSSRIESARVRPDSHEPQSTLFPLADYSRQPVSPRALCGQINLNWLAAMRLFENGWLSFDPSVITELNPAQEAELRFLGGLVVAGCEESMLRHLLTGLEKPYAYRLDQVYYNWQTRTWELAPGSPEAGAQFEAWLEELVDAGQMAMLEDLRACVDRSITDLRRLRCW